MAEFTRKPLQILDGIYKFVGGLRGTRYLDLGSDISLVHDVSRQSEKSGLGGYYGWAQWQTSFSVNGNLEDELFRDTTVRPALGLDSESDYEMWILGGSLWVSSGDLGDFDDCSFYHGTIVSRKYLQQFGTADTQVHLLHGEDTLTEMANTGGTEIYGTAFTPAQPVRTIPNGYIAVHASSSAACLIHATYDLWIGPAGSSPPGRG